MILLPECSVQKILIFFNLLVVLLSVAMILDDKIIEKIEEGLITIGIISKVERLPPIVIQEELFITTAMSLGIQNAHVGNFITNLNDLRW